jgi:hypothetical protein
MCLCFERAHFLGQLQSLASLHVRLVQVELLGFDRTGRLKLTCNIYLLYTYAYMYRYVYIYIISANLGFLAKKHLAG